MNPVGHPVAASPCGNIQAPTALPHATGNCDKLPQAIQDQGRDMRYIHRGVCQNPDPCLDHPVCSRLLLPTVLFTHPCSAAMQPKPPHTSTHQTGQIYSRHTDPWYCPCTRHDPWASHDAQTSHNTAGLHNTLTMLHSRGRDAAS